MATVFQKLGLDVPHEHYVGRDGISRWSYTHLRKEELPKPWFRGEANNEKYNLPADVIILHQVRHPLKVIASVTEMTDFIWEYVGFLAGLRGIDWNPLEDPHPLRGMKYWAIWNLFAEGLACYRYRIEALPVVFDELLGVLGLPPTPLPCVPTDTGTHNPSVSFTWGDLRYADRCLYFFVRLLAEKYGYEITE